MLLKSLWAVAKESWHRIQVRARRALFLYTTSLIVISGLDGLGLVLLSRLTKSNGDGGTLDSGRIKVGLLVIGLFLLRSALAGGITWIGYAATAREEIRVGAENFRAYSNMDWTARTGEQVADIYSIVDRGPFAMVQQLLLPIGTTLAEVINALVIFGILMFLDPATAATTVVFFVGVALLQHRMISVTMSRAGFEIADYQNHTYNVLSDAFDLGKPLRVMPSQSLEETLNAHRSRLAMARARAIFLESLPRYLMESMLALGVVVVGAVTMLTRGSDALLPSLSVFGVAGFRLLPIVNRIQGLILSLLGREPVARLALRTVPQTASSTTSVVADSADANILSLDDISFAYPGSNVPAIDHVSLQFERGKQYAFVGPSGSGKSTLVDMCLGLLSPVSGQIKWNLLEGDSLGYVPQDSFIAGTSLSNNVALEWDSSFVNPDSVNNALKVAALSEIPGERSDQTRLQGLSGGQRQRVGLARAIYRNANILFLDEPTSALDAETEHEVMSTIRSLRGTSTVFIVAHRISTIQDADRVIYVENGRILGSGTFDELRQSLPQFARQIELGTITSD